MENKLAKKELTKYEIIHMLFKGLNENISKLENDVKNNSSSSDISKLAYKIDRIASGLQYCLDFEKKDALKISENLRDIYRHIRFGMKCAYEDKNYKYVNGANDISKILLESWSKIKQ